MDARPPPRLYLGIAAAAGAVLALEIGLTRLFSYAIWYQFAYLAISVALLGYGAAGSALAALAIYAGGVLALCASERRVVTQSDGSRITSPAEPSAT